jgi:hypothetical protein
MIPYIILLLFLLAINLLGVDKVTKKYKRFFIICSFLYLWLFSGLRYQVGMDYVAYEEYYEQSYFGLCNDFKEPGFAYFFYVFKNMGVPFAIITLILSFFTILLIYTFIFRYSSLPFLSILIFYTFAHYYTYSFNVMRQVLASYIFLSTINLILERQFIKYAITIILTAYFVHATAIILLPLYFILHRSYSLKFKIILLVCCCLTSSLFVGIINNIEAYSVYLKFDDYAHGLSMTTMILMITSIIFLLIEVYKSKKTILSNILYNINYLVLVFLSISICFLNQPLILVFTRIAIYFTPIYIVLIPNIISPIAKSKIKVSLICIIAIIYSSVFVLQLKTGGEKNKFIPYKTVITK